MHITLNERDVELKNSQTLFELRDWHGADIAILNGHAPAEDRRLSEGDAVVLIRRGVLPERDELEALMMARHTPGVHAKVKEARVGIAGLGGLGSAIAVALARTGVGELLLVDFDLVEPSNLNRQHYFVRHLGMAKTEAMREIIAEINPYVKVETCNIYLNSDNVVDIFKNVNIFVEAFDNPHTKAAIVERMLSAGLDIPVVAASGMAGYFSGNLIKCRQVMRNLYMVGDETHEAQVGSGLMAPRVGIAAHQQANMVLRLILGFAEV